MKPYYIVLIILFAVLPSCKIGKKYARPVLNLPDQVAENENPQLSPLNIEDISWQSIYTLP